MTISGININLQNSLDFEVKIEGADAKTPTKARFSITENSIEYSFIGEKTNTGYKFSIPPLKGKISPGLYNCRLDVIIEDTCFTPLTEEIELVVPVVVSEAQIISKKAEPKIQVKVKAAIKGEPLMTDEDILKEEALLQKLDRMMKIIVK